MVADRGVLALNAPDWVDSHQILELPQNIGHFTRYQPNDWYFICLVSSEDVTYAVASYPPHPHKT